MDLKTARLAKTMSQAELARAIDSTPVSMSNYENGKTIPRPATKRRIEAIVGPVDWPSHPKQHLKPPTLGRRSR